MQLFSQPLREEISTHMFGQVISQVNAFSRFDQLLIHSLSQNIVIDVFAQDDVIFRTGETSTAFYFIEKGEVEVYHEESSHTLTVLPVRFTQAGHHFGDVAFFTGQPRCAAVRCLQCCQMLVLKRDDLLSLLTPVSQVAYDYIRTLYQAQDYMKLGLQCYICRETTHLSVACPSSLLLIDKDKVKQRWFRFRRTQDSLLSPSLDLANFRRRERKVLRSKGYSLANIKGQPRSADAGNQRERTQKRRQQSEDAMSCNSETLGLLRRESEWSPRAPTTDWKAP